MFAVANVLSLTLAGPRWWKEMTARVGFIARDEGFFNGSWFIVLERPAAG